MTFVSFEDFEAYIVGAHLHTRARVLGGFPIGLDVHDVRTNWF